MEKRKRKSPYLNASKQAECKIQYNSYYANNEDSIKHSFWRFFSQKNSDPEKQF